MIKKQTLIVLVLLFAGFMGFGQVSITGLGAGNTYTQDFNTLANTGTSTSVPTGWSFLESGTGANTIYSTGTGSSATGDTYSFGPSGNSERSLGGLQSGSVIPIIGASFVNNTGANITELIISYTGEQWRLGATGRVDQLDFQYSLNATSLTTGTWTDENNLDFITPTTTPIGALNGNLTANRTSKSFTITGLSIASGATFWFRWNDLNVSGADDGLGIDDFSMYAMGSTDQVDFCNVDFPENGSIAVGGNFTVYAQAYEPGITEAVGQATGLNAWIGYSTTDATSIADFTSASWTWVVASFNSQQGNNDQFEATLGAALPSDTYYYVSRFQLNGGPYSYGGKTPGLINGGNFWDGTNFVSGVLTVDQVDWCNLQSPSIVTIDLCDSFEVYGQVFEFGVTDTPNNQGSGIVAEVGYSTTNTNPSTWTNWIPTIYNPTCTGGNNCNLNQNDEYFGNLGAAITVPGTYYYAMRYTLNSGAYSYGGILADGSAGNFWDGVTYISGVLTVTNPPLADVVITEIMYNTAGPSGDDEWIEICNVSGSTQDISNYSIKTGVFPTETTLFTFPCGTTIANGTCKTISLGSNGDGTYNNGNGTPASGYCPFPPDFGIGANTNDTNHLTNTTGTTITLYAANGTDKADQVAYAVSDGGDGNGSSLHVIDATQDNSVTGTNWAEVAFGGSSGANTLLPNCLPVGIEINVEGNLGNFPDISDGHIMPSGTDNTLYAAQFVGASQSKSYRIQSLFSTDVIISNLTITGHSSDFNVTSAPSSPVTYLTPSILEITFSPTVPGTRTAIVHIFNNDADEGEYTFTIQGDGKCIGVINSILPTSGPEGTFVTVSASGLDLNSATASFNGVPATTVNYISATNMLEVTVPNGASDGNLTLLDGSGCTGIIAFDVIDTKISSCGGSGSLSDLIISEITDATTGGVTYIEIYNGTGGDVNLNGYSIEIFSNGGTSSNSLPLNNLMLPNDETYVVAIGVASSPVTTGSGANTCPIAGGNGELADQTSTIGGINKVDNQHDMIRLVNSGLTVDEFGVFQDNDWMDSTIVTGNRGFNFRRLNTVAAATPKMVFDISDWNVIDWVGSGLTSCSTNDYSDIGIFDFSTGTPPMVTSGPTIVSSCNTATISVTGIEGSDPAGLTYQWYTSAPVDAGWTALTNNSTYINVTTATLDILDTSLLEGYQYYCQIREDDADCYTASDAVQLTLPTTIWNGTSWSSPPTIDKIAIIDGGYDTGITGSFVACNLIINAGKQLNVADKTFVKVQNNVVVDGTIKVQTKGAFVQVVDTGTFTVNPGGLAQVLKTTSEKNKWYEFTYWSSPVIGETVENAFPDTPSNRRFWYNAQNYLDSTSEVGNNNQTVSGQDDIDDTAPWDWLIASGEMIAGLGYAATASPFVPNGTFTDQATFNGAFHTGEIKVNIYRNDLQMADNNWNLLGNPYPSAISADDFLTENAVIDNAVEEFSQNGVLDGAIFFWSQWTPPSRSTNGNQISNFSQDDYAIINTMTETKGGDGIKPERFIPSGQGFFISYSNSGVFTSVNGNIKTGEVIFNNSMRIADTFSNDQFFRTSGQSKSKKEANKLWLNLTSDNGVFNQIAVGYVENATDAYDGMGYDTPRNFSNPLYSSIYTLISGHDKKFAIQGKSPNSLNLDEVIPLGFDTTIDVATVYTLSIEKVEGDFLTSNTLYLKDNFLNKIHDLSASGYSFTSEVGEFKDRFEIVFQFETLSDVEAQLNLNNLTIIELNDGRVQLKTNTNLTITSVQILDMLGRTLYNLKGTGTTEIYNLNNLSQSTYIAKVELSNGQIVIKKAIKRN